MGATHRKCSVIIPVSPGAVVSHAFVGDLNEALIQMRGRQLHDVCVVYPTGFENLAEPLRGLCEGAKAVEYQLSRDDSIIACVNKGFSHAISKSCDAFLVLPGGMLSPDTLSTLSSVGNRADNFGIVSARVYSTSAPQLSDEQEALYLAFLEQSKCLYEWQETLRPPPFCCFIPFRLLRELNYLKDTFEFVGDALWDLSKRGSAIGFRSILHNATFHAFSPQSGMHLYVSSQDNETSSSASDAGPSFLRSSTLPNFVLRERLNTRTTKAANQRPSLAIDLTTLPSHVESSFEFGIHTAAAAHSRLTWDTTLLVPSRHISDLWDLSTKFPKAEILTSTPERCFDFALFPTTPKSLGEISSFVALSPYSYFFLQEPFGRVTSSIGEEEANTDTLCRIVNHIAQGVVLMGEAGEGRYRANLAGSLIPPLLSILPSQYAKDYPRYINSRSEPTRESVMAWLPFPTPEFLKPSVDAAIKKLAGTNSIVIGDFASSSDCCEVLSPVELKHDQVSRYLQSAYFVVFPFMTEELMIYLGRALALGKIVVTLESPLMQEFKQSWFGPQNLLTVQSVEELPKVIASLNSESERARFIASYSSQKPPSNSCQRWSQIGSRLNEFLFASAKRYPVTADDFIRKQSFISDLIKSTYHFYARELAEASGKITTAQRYIVELEDRVKKLESAQMLLRTAVNPEKRTPLQNALSAIQDWTTRPK